MKTFIAVVVILVVVVGGYFLFIHKAAAPVTPEVAPVTETAPTTATSTPAVATPPTKTVTITYTNAGFLPKSVSVAAGTQITWVNKSSGGMWVASNPHPIHNGYDGTTVSEHCVSGAPTSG